MKMDAFCPLFLEKVVGCGVKPHLFRNQPPPVVFLKSNDAYSLCVDATNAL